MKKILALIVLALLGCAHSRTDISEHDKALQIVDYGFSHSLGRSTTEQKFQRIKYGENVKYLNPKAYGVPYCFDCDMRERGVPEATLQQWHELVVAQLRERSRVGGLYDIDCSRCPIELGWNSGECELACIENQPMVTRRFSEMADAGGGPMWLRFRERVMKALTAREDFRRYVHVDGAPLCELGPYPDLWPADDCANDGTRLIDQALINVLIHARRCLSGADGCY